MKRILILITMLICLLVGSNSFASYIFEGHCRTSECPICGKIMTHWVEPTIGPYMPSVAGGYGICIAYTDENGIIHQNQQQTVRSEVDICKDCYDLYNKVLQSSFDEKLKQIIDEAAELRGNNQRINRERERKVLQKQRDDLDRKIKELR